MPHIKPVKAPAFFNSIEAPPQQAVKFEEAALNQKKIVLKFFELHSDKAFTPIQVHVELLKRKYTYQLTSTRRAITTLTADGELTKHPKAMQKKERFGVKNYTWQYNPVKDRSKK